MSRFEQAQRLRAACEELARTQSRIAQLALLLESPSFDPHEVDSMWTSIAEANRTLLRQAVILNDVRVQLINEERS